MHLASTELRNPYEPRECRVIKRLRSELRDDLALVELEPPLPASVYDTPEDLGQVILAARHQGSSLFPVTEWPLPVYICVLKHKTVPKSDALDSADIAILDWGEVRK
jgi:hypothetical protein